MSLQADTPELMKKYYYKSERYDAKYIEMATHEYIRMNERVMEYAEILREQGVLDANGEVRLYSLFANNCKNARSTVFELAEKYAKRDGKNLIIEQMYFSKIQHMASKSRRCFFFNTENF